MNKIDYNQFASFSVSKNGEHIGTFTCKFIDCFQEIINLLSSSGLRYNILQGQRAMHLALHGTCDLYGWDIQYNPRAIKDHRWQPRERGNWSTYSWVDDNKQYNSITVSYEIADESEEE